jgi:hypothetical protein
MTEAFIKQLIGAQDEISEGLMNGVELNANMMTMIGYKRLKNIESLITDVYNNNIEGDFIECGVWRGGACIFARYILNNLSSNKIVYVADSFEGCPPPEDKYIHDKGDRHFAVPLLSVSMDQVMENFDKFNLLEGTIFVPGWFKDTLPLIDNKFSIIRLDGDLYSSTMDALENLYPKLSEGGYCIIDDYKQVLGCEIAVHDYRLQNNITSEIIHIDKTAIYWKK